MSFFTTEVLPVLDGTFQHIRRSHRLKMKFQRKLVLKYRDSEWTIQCSYSAYEALKGRNLSAATHYLAVTNYLRPTEYWNTLLTVLIRLQYSSSNVHSTCKHIRPRSCTGQRHSPVYIFTANSTASIPLTSSIRQNYRGQQEMICSHD